MEVQITDDLELSGEEKDILESIVRDTGKRFEEIIDFAEIEAVNVGGPSEYRERNNRPMRGPGNSPPLWKHNPFSEGELQVYVQDPAHIPHEVAHQVENIYETLEKAAKDEETTNADTDSAVDKAFSEAFAYLNQLQYFNLPEYYDVEFDNVQELEENKTDWQEYRNNPRNHPDLYHTAGYQVALELDNQDVEPQELLAADEYSEVVEDAVAAAWIAGRNRGEIDRQKYNETVRQSIEERT